MGKREYKKRQIAAPRGTKEWRRQYMAIWNDENRSKVREQHRNCWRKKNGVHPTYKESDACEICGDKPKQDGQKYDHRLHADHNHVTGVFRGWLCPRCNTAIGLFKDSSDSCIAAARYLRASELLV